jgi:ribosomal protein S18 acetylase RimI-like enzyme
MISHPLPSEEPQLREIWKIVFSDSDEFIELFFRNRYSEDSALVHRHDGRVVSMLFFPRYDFKSGDLVTSLGYICGAATLPEYRGKGIMADLLNSSFDLMRLRGDHFTALIPASDSLYGYYERFGFREFFYRKKYSVARSDAMAGTPFYLKKMEDFASAYRIYSEAVSRLGTVVIQSERTYSSVVDEFRLSGGEVLVSEENGIICFVRIRGNTIFLRESFCASDDTKCHTDLPAALFSHLPGKNRITVEGPVPIIRRRAQRFRTGMIKPLIEAGGGLLKNDRSGYMKFMLED